MQTTDGGESPPSISPTITDKDFRRLIDRRARTLLGLAKYLSQCKSSREIQRRPLLGDLLLQSVQIEELLDAYNARNNCQWCSFRLLAATIRLFSDVSYELLHIQHVLPAYHLLPIERDFVKDTQIERDFVKDTQKALSFTGDVLLDAAKCVLSRAKLLGLSVRSATARGKQYKEELPLGWLPYTCRARKLETASETVTMLATAFLNLAAESADVCAAGKAAAEEYPDYLKNTIREENLRSLQLRFHNLQSLYDTYLSGTEAEGVDEALIVLRGHISVVFHLLKTATLFAHYYERHLNKQPCGSPTRLNPPVEPGALLTELMSYSVTYISLYIASAEQLCRRMLQQYSIIDRVEVPVPQYRGFHVRPSTLIAKLIQHYGSKVQMEMDEQSYDAGIPLQLFRANEQINARKRRWLAAEIARLRGQQQDWAEKDIHSVVRTIVLTLAENGKLILYQQPLQFSDVQIPEGTTVLEKVIDEMAALLAMGKIDIRTDMTAAFIGDKRVLADITLLAESGYGEDNYGNNVPLPDELRYLRQ
jgi:hypothetical protein